MAGSIRSPVEPDEKGQKRVDEITAELEQLEREMENESLEDDGLQRALREGRRVGGRSPRDLQEAYSEEDLARSGVIASWSNGQVSLHVGLVRPEDKVESSGKASGALGTKGATDSDEITYPASLTEDLKTERAMALGAAMAMHPEATLDLTLFKLVTDVLTSGMGVTQAFKVDARQEYRSHAKMDEIDGTSLEQVAEAHDALDLSWADEAKSPADQFALFRALDAGEKAKLVAYATAATTQSCFARDRQRDSLMHDFEVEIMPDIRVALDTERGALQPLQEGLASEDPRRGSGARTGGGDLGLLDQEGGRRLLRQALCGALCHADGCAARGGCGLVSADDADGRH